MNINGIGVVGYLAMYGMREIEGHVVDKNFADEISKAAERLETEDSDSGKAITKMRPMGDDVSETSELEDKYCSLQWCKRIVCHQKTQMCRPDGITISLIIVQ